jgi:hypothetical protein
MARASNRRIVSLERELAQGIRGIAIYATYAAADAAGRALKSNSDEFTRGVYRAIRKNAIGKARMTAANKELAVGAQRAIRNGWRRRLPVKAPPYRKGSDPDKDRLSGALGKALGKDSMTEATTDRAISFLNTGVLWNEARHWHRVNYGAFGPKVGSPDKPKSYPVTVNGHTLFALEDPGRPDPNSWLPRGLNDKPAIRYESDYSYFAPEGRRGQSDIKADLPGGGHRSALFTELGFKHVAKNLDPVYRGMLAGWVREVGADAVRRQLHAKGVRIKSSVLSGGG